MVAQPGLNLKGNSLNFFERFSFVICKGVGNLIPWNSWRPCLPGENGCSHVPNREEQMIRYYGYYSNADT
jgi:hypothetical protein